MPAEEPVLAQLLAVIGRDDDKQILEEAVPIELSSRASDLIVDESDTRIVRVHIRHRFRSRTAIRNVVAFLVRAVNVEIVRHYEQPAIRIDIARQQVTASGRHPTTRHSDEPEALRAGAIQSLDLRTSGSSQTT